MAYKINNTFGTLLVTLADGTIDVATTDLTLIGKGYAGFGEKLNENLIKLLENFNNTRHPPTRYRVRCGMTRPTTRATSTRDPNGNRWDRQPTLPRHQRMQC